MRISIIQVFKRVDSTVFFEDPVNNNVIVILNRDEIRFEDLQKNRIKKRSLLSTKKSISFFEIVVKSVNSRDFEVKRI